MIRISPSQINLYINEPVLWVLRYKYGIKSEQTFFMKRGVIVEEYINNFANHTDEQFYNMVFSTLLDIKNISITSELMSELKDLSEYAHKVFIDKYGKLDVPLLQTEVNGEICCSNIFGYLDYEFEYHIVDLKISNKLPSVVTRGARKGQLPTIKADNVRQQLIYWYLTGKPCFLMYVSPKHEHLIYQVSFKDYESYWDQIIEAVIGINRLLTLEPKDAIMEALKIKEPNFYQIYWDDNYKKQYNEIVKEWK